MTHGDIVLLGTCKVMEREVELLGRDDAEVGLEAVLEAHAGLRLAMRGDFLLSLIHI